MTVKIEQLDGLKRKMAATVLADDLQKVYQKRVADFAKRASIKGFRPGKVPLQIVEQQFGKGLLQEAAAELIQSTFEKGVADLNLTLVGSPDIEFDHAGLKKNAPFDYVAKFEVYPAIQLKDLDGAEVESFTGAVTDSDVDAMLIKLRTQHSEWQDVDRAAKLGDRLRIDFDGMVDGKPLDKGSAKDATLELGSKTMIPGFEDGLIGVKKDETKELKLAFPDDYHVEALRSKPAVFSVKVHAIQEPKLPALDDAFAQKFGEKEGVDALKASVKKRLEAQLEQATHAQLKQAVLDKLISLNTIDVPEKLIEMEIHNLQNMTRQQMRYYQRGLSEAQLKSLPLPRDPYVEEAKKRVVLGLLLSEVIKLHNIQVDRDKVNQKVAEVASDYPNSTEVVEMYHKNKRMLSEIEAFVLEEQAVQTLLSKATIKTTQKNYDAIMNANEEKQ